MKFIIVVPRLLQMIRSGILQKVKNKKLFSRIIRIAEKLPILLRRIIFYKIHKSFGNKLRYFICDGAPLDEEIEKFYDAIGITVVQGYGLTETSPVLTQTLRNDPIAKRVETVGKPLPNIKVKIIVTKSDDVFLAECPELDVFTQGKSLGDAVEKVHEAICLYLNTLEEEGLIREVFKEKNIKCYKYHTKQKQIADKSPIMVEQTYNFAC